MLTSLDQHVAIITGGASGIGRATALRFAAAGATVVIGDRQREPREGGTAVETEIADRGGTATTIVGDVRDADHRAQLVAAARDLGGTPILVNNAGIFRGGAFLQTTEAEYDAMMDVNVRACFFMAQEAARAMVDAGGGAIVNLSSAAGLQGAGGFALYCASKGAVRLLTYALADELGPHGIRVNALHPGFIDTTMTRSDVPVVGTAAGEAYLEQIPLRRAGTADDVARAALFLASGLGDYVNGASLSVDGGRLRI